MSEPQRQAIVVYHAGYGCETGCCGHRIYRGEDAAEAAECRYDEGTWTFAHPYGKDPLEWAKALVAEEFGAEHVADLDWEHCIVTNDC